MLNFMCNYENQYIFISTFLSINVDIIIIFYNIFIAFYSVYILFKVYLLTMIDKKVQVGKDQEKAQSEKDSHSKNQGGEKTKLTIRYLY